MFRLKKRYHLQSLPKALRRQFAPGPGMMEPAIPSRTKLVRVRVDRACLWSVCKSTSLAMCLIVIGATMAVMGFYAPELSSQLVTVGNTTYTSINTNAHWHLKNLTYVGPAFMGLGCVIIVAICVMTFEARDKAAKICPEQPSKLTKDDLYVNVIKNLVRKYSGVPKVAPHNQGEDEDASRQLIPIYTANKLSRVSQFLETPSTEHSLLGMRCSSEPCFTVTHNNNNNNNNIDIMQQLPLVQITPTTDVLLLCQQRCSAPPASFLISSSTTSTSAGQDIVVPNITGKLIRGNATTSGSSPFTGENVRRQSSVSSGETVVDIHPLPSSCCGNNNNTVQLPLQQEYPASPERTRNDYIV